MALEIAGGVSLAAWLYLLLARGGFWRMRPSVLPEMPSSPPPSVTAVIPARNEAPSIGLAVASLAKQDYPGKFQIVVADDDSSDGTAEAARQAAGKTLTVVRAEPLPPEWSGKLWALSQGIEHAGAPDYLLLTDADIVHPPGAVASLAAQARNGDYDLVSLMVALRCETLAERVLVPAFVFFFFMLYPPAWIRSVRRRTAGAAGGCILIRRETLGRIGGLAQIRGALIDDCALARAVKQSGGRLWLGVSEAARSIREYGSFDEIGRMISRTAFTQLHYSWIWLAGAAAGMMLTYLVPPVAALAGCWTGAFAWIAMCIAYLPVLRLYRRSPLWAPLLPLVAAFYLGATLHSAAAYVRGKGGMWKGRAQAR